MVKSGVKIFAFATASLTEVKPSVTLAATRVPVDGVKVLYVPATPAVYSMAWICQLVVARPVPVTLYKAVFYNSKVGPALVEKATQVHLLSTVIPTSGKAKTSAVVPDNSVATTGVVLS
jgi:hypothetical protein